MIDTEMLMHATKIYDEVEDHQNIPYEHEVHILLGYALNTRDLEVVDLVETCTNGWLEPDDQKKARVFLINNIRYAIESANYYYEDA